MSSNFNRNCAFVVLHLVVCLFLFVLLYSLGLVNTDYDFKEQDTHEQVCWWGVADHECHSKDTIVKSITRFLERTAYTYTHTQHASILVQSVTDTGYDRD